MIKAGDKVFVTFVDEAGEAANLTVLNVPSPAHPFWGFVNKQTNTELWTGPDTVFVFKERSP